MSRKAKGPQGGSLLPFDRTEGMSFSAITPALLSAVRSSTDDTLYRVFVWMEEPLDAADLAYLTRYEIKAGRGMNLFTVERATDLQLMKLMEMRGTTKIDGRAEA